MCNKILLGGGGGDKPSILAQEYNSKERRSGQPTKLSRNSSVANCPDIYKKIPLNRIPPHLDLILRMNQNGFKTFMQIVTMWRLNEGIKAKNITGVLTFGGIPDMLYN